MAAVWMCRLKEPGAHAAQAAWARAQQYALLAALRPDAVALVDAFGIEDYLLNSALGRADGDVYRALLAAARASPLNATQARAVWQFGACGPVSAWSAPSAG